MVLNLHSDLTVTISLLQCATHTHQLALDMQLSVLSPLLITLLWQWRVCGVVVLLCLHALSAVLRYVTVFRNQLSLVIYQGMT
jgi:hypothetical protein